MNLTPEKRNQIAKWMIKIAAVCILLYFACRTSLRSLLPFPASSL